MHINCVWCRCLCNGIVFSANTSKMNKTKQNSIEKRNARKKNERNRLHLFLTLHS